jgi:hypothetical protein
VEWKNYGSSSISTKIKENINLQKIGFEIKIFYYCDSSFL